MFAAAPACAYHSWPKLKPEDSLPPSPSDLADLIAASARGDRAAFQRLYEATAPKLLGVILRIVRSRAEAEDVLQDAYIRVWKSAGLFSPASGTAFGWIASIVRNRAIDLLRAQGTVRRVQAGEDEDVLARIADTRDDFAQAADREALRRCLDTVEPKVREMIVLAYCDGYSRDELAGRYASPANTIKTWLHRGLAALRTCLDEKT
jgi:RNA polymerase sigma factor (sigma-70 family)